MKFSFVWLSTLLLLTLLTESCIKSGRKRTPPECMHGTNADGTCRINLTTKTVCQGEYSIKEFAEGCSFVSVTQPEGCKVVGLAAERSDNAGCIVRDTKGKRCQLEGLLRDSNSCEPHAAISTAPAAVSLYLEVQEGGFKPHVVFDPNEKVQEGAELELEEQKYRGMDVHSSELLDGGTSLSMALQIPWRLKYTKTDGTSVCATGVLDASSLSRDNAARGYICP